MTALQNVAPPSQETPVIIDLGKHSKKQIKELRKGKPGKLLTKIAETIDSLRAQSALAADTQPIIVLVREKRRSSGLLSF